MKTFNPKTHKAVADAISSMSHNILFDSLLSTIMVVIAGVMIFIIVKSIIKSIKKKETYEKIM